MLGSLATDRKYTSARRTRPGERDRQLLARYATIKAHGERCKRVAVGNPSPRAELFIASSSIDKVAQQHGGD